MGHTHVVDQAVHDGIPLPIIRLNRAMLLIGVVLGLALQQPLVTTALLAILLPTLVWGERGSLVAAIGRRIFGARLAVAEREDRRLARFNNLLAAILLGAAQVAFLAGAPVLGWVLAGMVAIAAGVALAGFCIGCFIYYQFKLNRYRLFRQG
jgi:hypothetical protein